MKAIIITIICSLLLINCNSKQSLEQYFVENNENKNFIQLDISPSILNINQDSLTNDQKTALESFDKMNILAFKLDGNNKAEFEIEKNKVHAILKTEKYQQLMKFGTGKEGASISFVGDDEHISEFILFGNKTNSGFGIVRILGKDMNPNSIMTMISILQHANIDMKQLKPIIDMATKK